MIAAPLACTSGVRQLLTSGRPADTAGAAFPFAAAFFRARSDRLLLITSSSRAIGWPSSLVFRPLIVHVTPTRSGQPRAGSINAISRSGVIGRRHTSRPIAFAIALKIAGAGPSIGSSPMPLAPAGPCGYGTSSK